MQAEPVEGPSTNSATMWLMVGLPGSGKTTRAAQLAAEHRALRLSPDEWMIPLFGESAPDGKRDVLEGRLIDLGLRALTLGVSVVLDFGFWSRAERSALCWLAGDAGTAGQVVYLPIDEATQWARVAERLRERPADTVAISEAELAQWRAVFEPPDAAELAGGSIDPPAEGWPSWAANRWPSLGQVSCGGFTGRTSA